MKKRSNYINCPLCERKDFKVVFESSRRKIVECKNDGLVFVNPQPLPSEVGKYYSCEYFKANFPDEVNGGTGFVNYQKEENSLRKYFSQKIDLIEKYTRPPGKFLDVGCALGYALSEAKKKGWLVRGLDISDYAVSFCKKAGLDVDKGTFEALSVSSKFSVVFASHILEHVLDPYLFLKKASQILEKDGVLYLAMPNQQSFIARLLGKKWFDYQRDQHLWFFSNKTLTALLEKSGLETVEAKSDLSRFPLDHIFLRVRSYYKNRILTGVCLCLAKWSGKLRFREVVMPLGNMYVIAKK